MSSRVSRTRTPTCNTDTGPWLVPAVAQRRTGKKTKNNAFEITDQPIGQFAKISPSPVQFSTCAGAVTKALNKPVHDVRLVSAR